MALTVAIVGTVAAIGAGVSSTLQAKKAQKAENQIRTNQLRRERVKQLRAARIKRGEIENLAVQIGAGGSSAAVSAAGQTTTEAARNISFLDTQGALSLTRARAQQRSRFFSSLSQLGGQVSSFATSTQGTQLLSGSSPISGR